MTCVGQVWELELDGPYGKPPHSIVLLVVARRQAASGLNIGCLTLGVSGWENVWPAGLFDWWAAGDFKGAMRLA